MLELGPIIGQLGPSYEHTEFAAEHTSPTGGYTVATVTAPNDAAVAYIVTVAFIGRSSGGYGPSKGRMHLGSNYHEFGSNNTWSPGALHYVASPGETVTVLYESRNASYTDEYRGHIVVLPLND